MDDLRDADRNWEWETDNPETVEPINPQYKETFHILHAIISIIFFPWVLVWIGIHLSHAQYNEKYNLKNTEKPK